MEALAGIMVLLFIVSTGLGITYLCFARIWIDRATYEATVCLASDTGDMDSGYTGSGANAISSLGAASGSVSASSGPFTSNRRRCEALLRSSLEGVLNIGKVQSLRLERSSTQAMTKVVFTIQPFAPNADANHNKTALELLANSQASSNSQANFSSNSQFSSNSDIFSDYESQSRFAFSLRSQKIISLPIQSNQFSKQSIGAKK
jgi:hypothetical protein